MCPTLEEMELSELGARLRQAREQKGLTRQFVADSLGVSIRTFDRWERGDFEPSLKKLARLAKLYGTSLGCLVVGDSNAA